MGRLAPFLVAVMGAALIAFLTERPPAPQPVDAAPTVFSAARALADLREIARAPHPTGSAESARVRDYLVGRLEQLGLEVRTQSVPIGPEGRRVLRHWGGSSAETSHAMNVVGVLAGRDRREPAVAIMAHYDTVWGSPGAADDGAGVVAALEIVRGIRASGTAARDVVVLLTDAEEIGLEGAKGFFDADPLAKRIGAIVNMEARGGGGRAVMFETGHGNGAMMDLFRRSVANPSTNSLEVFIYEILPNDTDFTAPKAKGIAGFNFGFLARPSLYHSPLATVEALDPGSLQHIGAQALDITRALANVSALPGKAPDRVFWDLFGIVVIAYPTERGWVVLGIAGAFLGLAFMQAGRATGIGWRAIVRGLVVPLWAMLHAMLLLHVGNLVSGSAAADTNYYDRLAAIPRLEIQAALLCLAVILAAAVSVRPSRRAFAIAPALLLTLGSIPFHSFWLVSIITSVIGITAACLSLFLPAARQDLWSGWLGVAALVFFAAVIMQIIAPTGAPMFAWPVALIAVAAGLTATFDLELRRPITVWLLAAVAAVAGAWLLSFAHLNFLALGADLPETMAIFVVLMSPLLWPLLQDLRNPRFTPAIVVVALLTCAALGLWVRLDPLAPSVPRYDEGQPPAAQAQP